MFLLGALGVIIASGLTAFTNALTRDRVATENTNVAAVGMNELTRVVRAATSIPVVNAVDLPAFSVADKEKIVVYAYIDSATMLPRPIKVQFEVNAATRDLVETRWAAHAQTGYPSYWQFDTTPQSVRTIARKIVVPATGESSLFTYYKVNSATLLQEPLAVPAGGIASADLAKISVVGITVKVQSDTTGRAAPVTLTNQVGIPNLGVSRLGLS